MQKKLLYNLSLYAFSITISIFIFWFSSISNLNQSSIEYSLTLERIFYIPAFALLTLSIFRAIIGTIKLTILSLNFADTKREKLEDKSFTLIIETLVMIIAILFAIIIAILDQYILSKTLGRTADETVFLIKITSIMLAGLLNYSRPIINNYRKHI